MLKLLGRIHRSETNRGMFTRFAGVGVTISLIDIGLLYLLIATGLSAYLARIPSFLAAMTVGYILNRYFTFHHLETGRALWHSLLRHYSVHSVGGVINYGVFGATLIIGQQMGGEIAASASLPFVAVWVGGIFGMCFNFFFSKKMVFDS
ncbi:MAG: GtrA family protein [Verrucomicrobiota bacterium]